MKILITNHWLKKLGGSETFTYTLGAALKKAGHQVDLFTFIKGKVSKRILTDHGIVAIHADSKKTYDLILANHNTCIDAVHGKGFIIQTCHGTTPKLEQPNAKANLFVSISEEVQNHLKKLGIGSVVIRNGIDCKRFRSINPINKEVKKILSLVHSDQLNIKLAKHLSSRGIQLIAYNKFTNPEWDMERLINTADMVISLGRGAYEAMACGRPVLVLDHRKYQPELGDGLITPDNINEIIQNNCSGRTFKRTNTLLMLDQAIEKYNVELGYWCRQYAVDNLNIYKQIKKYISLYEQNKQN